MWTGHLGGRGFLLSGCYIGCPHEEKPPCSSAHQIAGHTVRSHQCHSVICYQQVRSNVSNHEMTNGLYWTDEGVGGWKRSQFSGIPVTSLGVNPGTSLATLSQFMGWGTPHRDPSTMSKTRTLLS